MNLTSEQLKAIDEIDNNLQIIACAGSGKTEVISRRIANILQNKKGVNPENIVAFTFTEKAATSLKNRIQKAVEGIDISKMYIGTIHSFCYNILHENCLEYKNFKVLDTVKNYHFINRYYKICGMKYANLSCFPRNIKLFLDCIDKLVYDYDNNSKWSEKDKTIFDLYKTILYEKNYFDFSMLIHETIKVLKNNKEILKDIKYLIVDEYQDVDDLQEQIIECFADNLCNICVVGDDDQTIYRFRGSNANNMINFAKKYNNVKQIRLERNFRCLKNIVDIADSVIVNNYDRLDKKMISGNEKLSTDIKVKAIGFENKDEQYDYISDQIIKLKEKGTDYNGIAVLVRKGKFIKDIVKSFNKYSIPYFSDSAEYFFENKYFDLLKKTFDILPNMSKKELFDLWGKYCVREKFTSGFVFLRSAIVNNNYLNLSDTLLKYVELIGFLDEADDIELRKDILKGMKDILDDYEEIYLNYQLSAKIKGIINFLNNSATEQYKYHNFKSNEVENGVQIMTIHKAKGLEFEAVIIPNIDSNEFPASDVNGKKYWHVLSERFQENKKKFEGDIEDERKLFYVAITRAKKYLLLTYNKFKPSPFLIEASSSVYLDIEKSDLIPKKISSYNCHKIKYNHNNAQKEKVRLGLVNEAINSLYDYYWINGHSLEEMYKEIDRIKNMSSDDIIQEARKNCHKIKYNHNNAPKEKVRLELVNKAINSLYDYYWVNGHSLEEMYKEIDRIKNMSSDDIIQEARKKSLI